MNWFSKLLPTGIRADGNKRNTVPEGLWAKCTECNAVLYRAELDRNLEVCPKCDHHMRISGRRRLEGFLDKEPRVEIGEEVPEDLFKTLSIIFTKLHHIRKQNRKQLRQAAGAL